MKLINFIKYYIRGYDRDLYSIMPTGYTVVPIETDTGMNRDLSTVLCILFFAIFWLGMENYTALVQYVFDTVQRKRTERSSR